MSASDDPAPPRPEGGLTHYKYIDALRGFAFLGVLTVHARWRALFVPFHTVAEAGMFGVQLFFLLSAVTLLRSMSLRTNREAHPTRNFFIRRLFRIAPLFWFGMLFYSLVHGTGPSFWAPDGLHAWQFVTTFFFAHGWLPGSIDSVVPGGWSIAAEMTFYLLLPLLVRRITGARQALAAAGIALAVAMLLAWRLDGPLLRWIPTSEAPIVPSYFYYWFPAQLPVFLLGMAVYHALHNVHVTRALAVPGRPQRLFWLAATSLLALTAAVSLMKWNAVTSPLLPIHVLYAGVFAIGIIALAARPFAWVVNPATCALGTLSFSCYLTHFFALDVAEHFIRPETFASLPGKSGEVAHFAALWVGALLLTVAMSTATYRLIEKPGVRLGNWLIRLDEARRPVQPAANVLAAGQGAP